MDDKDRTTIKALIPGKVTSSSDTSKGNKIIKQPLTDNCEELDNTINKFISTLSDNTIYMENHYLDPFESESKE